MLHGEITGATLDEALRNIAFRSFYEDAAIVREDDGTYSVESTSRYLEVGWDGQARNESPWRWYSEPTPTEHTRLMESCETFATAEHIRYNLPDVVGMLEDGSARRVEFTYQVVNDETWDACDCEEALGVDECVDSHYVGWALAAYAYGDNDL